ncbi:hypothetical protein QBC45DRAFT_417134 [Copromyces sp. CBS 386.78]|nr:hypothetical protein QBC45DRAFT_417134 [Copromyces sp. CBS 386.78]
MATEVRISSLVSQGIKALKQLVKELEENIDTHTNSHSLASSYLSRFKVWAGSIGAHRPSGTKSLEYKLRDASLIRDHIVSLLKDLCGSIDHARHVISKDYLSGNGEAQCEGNESTNDELAELFYSDDEDCNDLSELEQALGRILNTINCLLRLSATIRNPAPHDHFKSRATDLIRAFEPRYKDHIKYKFVNPDEALVDRLAKSMVRRREYFRYREAHVTRLAAGMDKVEAGEDLDGAQSERRTISTAISSLPDFLKGGTAVAAGVDDLDELDDVRSLASQATSYAATEIDSGEPRVPEMPAEFYREEVSKCPFCHVFISIQTRYEWKKHVFRDLQPYNCLEIDCSMPNHQFERRSEWAEHMRREHWQTWHCSLGCENSAFANAAEFNDHLKSAHREEIGQKSLSTSLTSCSIPDPSRACGPCPVCAKVNITSEKHYLSHVGTHLEQLALFILPRLEYEGEDQYEDDESEALHDDSEEETGSVNSSTFGPNDDEFWVQSWQQNQLAESSSGDPAPDSLRTSGADSLRAIHDLQDGDPNAGVISDKLEDAELASTTPKPPDSTAPHPPPGPSASTAASSAAGEPSQGSVHRAQIDFKPTLNDELALQAGELVHLLGDCGDGWALCTRLDRSQKGLVPRVFLSERPVKPAQVEESTMDRSLPEISDNRPTTKRDSTGPTSPTREELDVESEADPSQQPNEFLKSPMMSRPPEFFPVAPHELEAARQKFPGYSDEFLESLIRKMKSDSFKRKLQAMNKADGVVDQEPMVQIGPAGSNQNQPDNLTPSNQRDLQELQQQLQQREALNTPEDSNLVTEAPEPQQTVVSTKLTQRDDETDTTAPNPQASHLEVESAEDGHASKVTPRSDSSPASPDGVIVLDNKPTLDPQQESEEANRDEPSETLEHECTYPGCNKRFATTASLHSHRLRHMVLGTWGGLQP